MDSTFTFSFIASTWKGNSERQIEEEKTNGKFLITATDREKRANGHLMQGNNATFDTNVNLRFHLSDR